MMKMGSVHLTWEHLLSFVVQLAQALPPHDTRRVFPFGVGIDQRQAQRPDDSKDVLVEWFGRN